MRVVVSGSATGLRYAALAPNTEGVVTELMAQSLRSVRCLPRPERYRTRGFARFGPEGLAREVDLPPGAWAAAVRFLRADTGQETRAVPLGIFEVGYAPLPQRSASPAGAR